MARDSAAANRMALSEIGHDILLSGLNMIPENGDGCDRIAPLHRLD